MGIPKCYFYGTEKYFNIMIMDVLGPSLEDLFKFCDMRLKLKTVL